jgi:hypothetical protein
VPDGRVDVIVTDPPWGEYDDLGMPYAEFARTMVKSFSRVLKPTGRFVILTSRKTATIMEREFTKGGFSVNSAHEILVNGHPATVLVGAGTAYWAGTGLRECGFPRRSRAGGVEAAWRLVAGNAMPPCELISSIVALDHPA